MVLRRLTHHSFLPSAVIYITQWLVSIAVRPFFVANCRNCHLDRLAGSLASRIVSSPPSFLSPSDLGTNVLFLVWFPVFACLISLMCLPVASG
ncbi:hypothetical protein C8J57DRAFT_1413972 [Mycena rebaudengoi]|nr:hypothetical protein C8J57DRAFT_1413972 [Mycena rebaudengoi]